MTGTPTHASIFSFRRAARSTAASTHVAVAITLALFSITCHVVLAQGVAGEASVTVIQQAAPHGATRSLSFLSSGYIDEAGFLNDVTACRNALLNNSAGIIADPWPRYMPFVNVYGVYEASPQPGASRPQGALHDCTWMKTCAGPDVRNNLGCAFGTPNPNLLSCDINKVVSLATAAPAQDVVVVLVNASDAGGVATDGIAYITNNAQFMAYMLVHYLNRAMAHLHEEYSLGVDVPDSTASLFVAPNCATSRENALKKWDGWLTTPAAIEYLPLNAQHISSKTNATAPHHHHPSHGEPPFTSHTHASSFTSAASSLMASVVFPTLDAATLGEGCTFRSFVAPSEEACLMRNSSVSFMCPICREQLSKSFFTAGVEGSVLPQPSRSTLDLTSQRCPPVGFTVNVGSSPQDVLRSTRESSPPSSHPSSDTTPALYVVTTPALYLSMGDALNQNDMGIVWRLNSTGEVLAVNTTTLALGADTIATWSLPATVTAQVTDGSPYVRGAAFSASTAFHVAQRTASTVCMTTGLPTCLSDLAPAAPGWDACLTAEETASEALTRGMEGGAQALMSTRSAYEAVDVLGSFPGEVYHKENTIIVACVTGGVAVVFLVAVFSVFCCVVRRRPREVLNAQLRDRIMVYFLVPFSVASLAIVVLVLIFAATFIPEDLFAGLEMLVAAVVFGTVIYLVAVFNICAVLFRWYAVCLTCCVLLFLISLAYFALGIVALWAHFNQHEPGLSDQLAALWVKTVASEAKGNTYICSVQYRLQCSGFHAGCFMTNSPECPTNCKSNLYVNACQAPFFTFIGSKYLPIGILLVMGGFVCVMTATLDTLYFMRYRQLSRTGRHRRLYRTDPHAPVVPITHHECQKARGYFQAVCSQPDHKLQGKAVVDFLETIFGSKMEKKEQQHFESLGPLTFDAMMSAYFPYMVASATDPRMLTSDEADEAGDMIDLQRKQYAKLQAFARAAGPLSPEKLREVYQHYAESRFMPQSSELLETMRHEAARSPDAPMCRGLSPMELEGLRAAWVALHPKINGTLSNDELRTFHEWCHGVPLEARDEAGLATWRRTLDVRETGTIGWGEFCYPYAQRALLREARLLLSSEDKEVPPEMLSRKSATAKYGAAVVDQCFLPYEKEVPLERLLACLLHQKGKGVAGGESKGSASAGDSMSARLPTFSSDSLSEHGSHVVNPDILRQGQRRRVHSDSVCVTPGLD